MSARESTGPAAGQLQHLSNAARAARRRELLNAALRRGARLLPWLLAYLLVGVVAIRWARPSPAVQAAFGAGLVIACSSFIIAVALAAWARRPAHAGALALDRHHATADRITNALAFAALPREARTPFMDAAIADALGRVEHPSPRGAVPLRLPSQSWVSLLLALAVVGAARLPLHPREGARASLPAPLPVSYPALLSEDDVNLLEEVGERWAPALDDPALSPAISEFNRIVEEIAERSIEREELFRRLAALERSLAPGSDAEALDEGLRELAEQLSKSPLSRPTAEALKQSRLPDAERALRELAEKLKQRQEANPAELERLRQALEAAAAQSSGRVERLEAARREAEQQQRRLLQKKGKGEKPAPGELAENERHKRRLERLERETSGARAANQALSQLDKELAEAARQLMRELGQSAKHLESGAEQVNRMARQQLTEQQKQELKRQLEELRELLRQGGADKQKHLERLQQFARRARGKPGDQSPPDGPPGEPRGPGGKPRLALGTELSPSGSMGQGSDPGGDQPKPGEGQAGGREAGSGSDGDRAGGGKGLDGKTLDVSAAALDTGQGTASSEVVYGAAERGFTGSRYQKVYAQYRTVAEEVLQQDQIPAGYEFYVRRYFQLIRPRDTP